MKQIICENCGASYFGEEVPGILTCTCKNQKFKIVEEQKIGQENA